MISAKDILGKVVGVVILAGFLVGLLLVIATPYEMYRMADARTWPSRKGVITHSSASEVHSRRGNHWKFVIKGTFQDTEQTFVLTRARFGDIRWGKGKAASLATVRKYPVGREVDVYYSPDNPREMILEPFAPRDKMETGFAIGLGFVLLPVLLYAFRKQINRGGD